MPKDPLKIVDKAIRELEGKKEEKPVYCASFPNLIDLVLNDEEVKFLLDTGELREIIEYDNKIFKPPNQSDLDYLLPYYQKVNDEANKHQHPDITDDTDVVYGCGSCLKLYNDLIEYHKQFSDLPNPLYYDLLVLWDFHTYLIENFIFSPIIYFFASKERGKTRTAKGMINVARHGIMTETLREANLIRWSRDQKATLLFDVKDFPKKVERSQSEDLIYGRVEKGVIASRVLFPEKGAFRDTVRFEVFGPTVVTSNKMIDETGESRAFIIDMKPTKNIFNIEPTPELGLSLKERLTGMRFTHFNKPFRKVIKKEFGRLEDLLLGYAQMIKTLFPEKAKQFIALKKLIKEQKIESAVDSFEARILQVIINKVDIVEEGSVCLTFEEICNEYNKDKRENLKIEERSMARVTKGMGFTSKRNSLGTKRGIFYDTDLIEQLKLMYGIVNFEDSTT